MARKRKPELVPEPEEEEEKEETEVEDSSGDEDDDGNEEEEEEEEDEEEEEQKASRAVVTSKKEELEEEASDHESLRKFLSIFEPDKLREILKEAALKNPAIFDRIASSAKSDPVHRKIFVHSLGWDTTNEVLAAAFAPYGDIEECKVVTDRQNWGRCKGYGFVLFRTRSAAERALKEPQKKIGNRTAACQLASAGPPGPEGACRKVYVSNVGDHIDPDRLRAFFKKFGEIEEGPLGVDHWSGKPKGFAIFVYKTSEGCKKALEEPKKLFDGCELNCQRAVEGYKQKYQETPSLAVLQPHDLALQSIMGLNPMAGLMGQGLNPALGLLGQNAGVGLLNQGTAAASVSPSLNRSGITPPYGVELGIGGGGTGVNSISPSVIGTYASHAALQGLGAYPNANLSSSTRTRSQSGVGSTSTGFSSYLSR